MLFKPLVVAMAAPTRATSKDTLQPVGIALHRCFQPSLSKVADDPALAQRMVLNARAGPT